MTHGSEKSDLSIVAMKPANKLGRSGAESVERREGAKGNTDEDRTCRTPSRESVSLDLDRVREGAKTSKKERFTALLHHVTIDRLRSAFTHLKRDAAPGVDGVTWQQYAEDLEGNLVGLHSRVHRARM
jgi:RNA-directed DNA polymerase